MKSLGICALSRDSCRDAGVCPRIGSSPQMTLTFFDSYYSTALSALVMWALTFYEQFVSAPSVGTRVYFGDSPEEPENSK